MGRRLYGIRAVVFLATTMLVVANYGCKDVSDVSQKKRDHRTHDARAASMRPPKRNIVKTLKTPSSRFVKPRRPDSARRPIVRDVTMQMSATPTLRFDSRSVMLLGGSSKQARAVLQKHFGRLDDCLKQLSAYALRNPPLFIDFTLNGNGKPYDISFVGRGTKRAQRCLSKVISKLDFGKGGKQRSVMIKFRSSRPSPLVRDSSTDALTWTIRDGGFEFMMKATRRHVGADGWQVEVEARLTALKKKRGIGESLRFDSKLVHPGGGSSTSFSAQTSTKVKTCLKPTQTKRLVRRARPIVRRGGRVELRVYLLGGRCADGKGRWEVGTIHLDWTRGSARPTLHATRS